MKVVFSEKQLAHDPKAQFYAGRARTAPESPARGRTLLQASLELGMDLVEPQDYGWGLIEEVHELEYLEFLETAYDQWTKVHSSGPEVFPHLHPGNYLRARPRDVQGKAGLYMNSTNCPIGPHTIQSAYQSAQAALTAAKILIEGESVVYALCRPPGHHAHRDMASAFCFLNNAAIAANMLAKYTRPVAIIDVDVHHGNGTQEIFYECDYVFCGSVHADPSDFYPFYQGFVDEIGEGPGKGWNRNIPLSVGSSHEDLIVATRSLVEQSISLECGAIVVALGFDTYKNDPLGRFQVETDEFQFIAAELMRSGLPLLFVQEGGYDGPSLGDNLKSFMKPLLNYRAHSLKSLDKAKSLQNKQGGE